jgi:hypothetical protein
MATPATSWPVVSYPNPNPTWLLEGTRGNKTLTVVGVAAIRDSSDYFIHSAHSVDGAPIVNISPYGDVTRYDSLTLNTVGDEQEDGSWEWKTYFWLTCSLGSLYDDGPIGCKVRFTGTHEGERVDVDSPPAQFV